MHTVDTAFKELFANEYNNLCKYAMSYLQDSHAAEDVVQETFVKFWEQKKDLVHSAQAKFYLITAVRNNCISALRKHNKTGVRYMEQTPERGAELFTTARQVKEDEGEQAKKIADALGKLPPKCKEVFLLVKLHGLSYKQAAATLDLSVKTIENQMGKAIKTLREHVTAAVAVLLIIGIKNILWR